MPAALAPWQQWLETPDAAGVVLPPGLKRLTQKARDRLQKLQANLAAGGEQEKAASAVFDVYGKMLDTVEKEVTACGFGLHIDKAGVVRITSRVTLLPGGKCAQLVAQAQPPKEDLLKGLPAGPFVLAAGTTSSQAMWDSLLEFSTEMTRLLPRTAGLSEEQARETAAILLRSHQRGPRAVDGNGRRHGERVDLCETR